MMKKSKLQTGTNIFTIIVGVLFMLFFIYIGSFENVSIYKARNMESSTLVEPVSVKEIVDAKTPVGVKKEYSWTMQGIDADESCLSFYLVHHYVEVYFGDELMYRLVPKESNLIGKSVSSNWIIIPIYPEDNGKEVRVITTPVYKSVVNREIVFKIGPYASVFMEQLKHDFPQLFLGLLCTMLGVIQILFFLRQREKNFEIMHLSFFSILLGLWKITDTRMSPILFPSNTMALGYFAIAMLFLCNLPVLLFARSRTSDAKAVCLLNITTLVACISTLGVLLCQVVGIAEFRETIILCHVMLMISILVISFVVIVSHKQKTNNNHTKTSIYFTLLLGCGGIMDMITFYIKGNSSTVFATMVTFIIYSSIVFVISIRESNQKAYTDVQTSLYNKRRCNEIINDASSIAEPMGMMMLDLNSLKYINDTFGHEAGDEIIFAFANILRNTIPQNNTICRWGGDEFVIIVANASRVKMESYLSAIEEGVNDYNVSHSQNAIYYAVGYALSSDFKSLNRKELFEKADEAMYLNKKKWYETNDSANRRCQS